MNTNRPRRLHPNTVVLIRQIMVGVLIFGFLGGVLLGIWYGTRIQALSITEIEVEGGETISHDEVRQRAAALLEGTYLGLIPKRFAWFYPKAKISDSIKLIPRVSSVVIDRDSGTVLSISFSEYRPTALWCADLATSTCVFLSETGYAFAAAPQLSGGSFVRIVTPQGEPMVGQTPISNSDISYIQTLVELLSQNQWFVSHIEVDSVRDAFLKIVGGGEFKVTLTLPVEQTVANLLTVVTSEEFSDIKPGTFQYIDLRFGNKVYVNEELVTNTLATTTATSSEISIPEERN